MAPSRWPPNKIYFGGYGIGYGDLDCDGYTTESLIRPYYGDGTGEVSVRGGGRDLKKIIKNKYEKNKYEKNKYEKNKNL